MSLKYEALSKFAGKNYHLLIGVAVRTVNRVIISCGFVCALKQGSA